MKIRSFELSGCVYHTFGLLMVYPLTDLGVLIQDEMDHTRLYSLDTIRHIDVLDLLQVSSCGSENMTVQEVLEMDRRYYEFSGSYREMGRQHGEAMREGAKRMCDIRLELSLKRARQVQPDYQMAQVLEVAAAHLPFHEQWCPDSYQELLGISEGAGIAMMRLVVGNGYTDFVDVLVREASGVCECTSIAATGAATADGRLHLGQTWDMGFAAADYVVCIKRQPDEGPSTVGITTAGCLSLIGMNEAGICIGNTNVTPTDGRPGVIYLATMNEALRRTSFDEAVATVKQSPRASGHYFYLGGPEGQMVGLETTATQVAEVAPDGLGLYAHTNHYQERTILQWAARREGSANSVDRQGRARQLLEEGCGELGVAEMMEVLSDHAGDNPICRHTQAPASGASLAAVVMTPEERRISFTIGNACANPAVDMSP